MEVGDSHVFDEIGMVGVIVDDSNHVGGKFAGPPASEQIEQAMRLLARHDRYPRFHVGEAQIDRHVEFRRHRRESGEDVVPSDAETFEFEFDALEENVLDLVGVLFGVHDVAVVRSDELGNRGDDTSLIGARKQENASTGHPGSLLVRVRFRTPRFGNQTDGVPIGDEDVMGEPLVIRSAGTLLDEAGEVYPVVRLDANARPELPDLVGTIARDGVGDLTTFAELRLGEGGRRFVRLISIMSTPVQATWSVDFALPGFEDLLRLAAETGGIVMSFLVDGDDGDRWLGVNLDGDALVPLLT